MTSAPATNFERRPYTVTYKDFHTGEIKKLVRRPPAKLHPILPTDQVVLTSQKGADWPSGDEYSVKQINPKQPNILKIEDNNGKTTFVDYFDVRLSKEIAARNEDGSPWSPEQGPRRSYTQWP